MNIDFNFNFDYISNYPDKKDELKKMYLLTYDGLRIPTERIDDNLYFECPFVDINNNIYVIPVKLRPFSLSRPDEKSRQDMLKQKFNTNYYVKEYYIFIAEKYSHKSMYVFTEEQRFQDGIYLKVSGIITYASFTWQEEKIIKPLLEKAFRFKNNYVPEFQYRCPDNTTYMHTDYDVEVKLKEKYPELERYSLENISKAIYYATTHSVMNINEITQLTSINEEDIHKILSATSLIWNH